jgi:hypothetical protein
MPVTEAVVVQLAVHELVTCVPTEATPENATAPETHPEAPFREIVIEAVPAVMLGPNL